MRGGLAWIDRECLNRFDKRFVDCTAAQRTARARRHRLAAEAARRELSHGIAFFTSFRDLTASGFWTTKMGMADLQYMGNTCVAEWKGCPDEVAEEARPDAAGMTNDGMRAARTFLASFLVLFLEIALIRWMPAYIRLLVVFLELHPARELPRHRRRLPARAGARRGCSTGSRWCRRR